MNLEIYIKEQVVKIGLHTESGTKESILKNMINVPALIDPKCGPIEMSEKTFPWQKKIAKALLIILIENFDSLPEFLNELSLTESDFRALWEGRFRPGRIFMNKITEAYNLKASDLII